MKRVLCIVVATLAVAAVQPAGAATYTIYAKDMYFSPASTNKAMGSYFKFVNSGDVMHNTKLSGRVVYSWWNEDLSVNEAWTTDRGLQFASRYKYYCTLHGGMVGSVGIPVRVSPTSGSTATTFTVRLATVDAPSGYVYDVQRKKGSGEWKTWKTGLKNDTVAFKAGSLGNGYYYFRSRLRYAAPSTDRALSYSPSVRITVG